MTTPEICQLCRLYEKPICLRTKKRTRRKGTCTEYQLAPKRAANFVFETSKQGRIKEELKDE